MHIHALNNNSNNQLFYEWPCYLQTNYRANASTMLVIMSHIFATCEVV